MNQRNEIHDNLPGKIEYKLLSDKPSTEVWVCGEWRDKIAVCCHCKAESKHILAICQYRTADGFTMNSPTCKHGGYITCPKCNEEFKGCPICGSTCVYT